MTVDPDTPRIVLGTVQLGTEYGIANRSGRPSREEAIAILRRADEAGVMGFDSAPGYGDAEELLGDAAVTAPVFTKVTGDLEPRESVERSLRRLKRSSVDLLFLHDPQLLLDDPMGIVDQAYDLVGSLVGGLGASVYTPEQFEAAMANDRIKAIQAPVSFADRRLEAAGLLRAARVSGTRVFARSVFLQGALLLEPARLPRHLAALRELGEEARGVAFARGESVAATLMAYVRDLSGVEALVVGCESSAQLEENLRAVTAPPLSEEHRARLTSVPVLASEVVDPRCWPAMESQ